MSPFQKGFIVTMLIGFLAGALAKLVMPGKDPGGCIITMLIGVAGAWIATLLGQAVNWYKVGEPTGFIGATVGAILLLAVYRMVVGNKAP